MATSDIIAIVLILSVVIAVIGYFIIKSNGKNKRIRTLVKEYPSLALILLNCEKLPPISEITEEQSAKILSLLDNDWEEWESLRKRVGSLAEKYPHTLYDFINSSFPKCKERVNYKNGVKLFAPIPQKVKVAVASLLLEELRKIDADPENVWKEWDALRLYATNIRQKYPEGYKSYCLVHNDKLPKDSVVVNNKKHIAELQKLFDKSKAYEGWEKKQEEFCSKFWQILKDVRSQDGRYTYEVSFNKPTRKGTLIESKFKVWQGFCKSFSTCLLDKQTESYLQRYKKIEEFKNLGRYFYERVYEDVFSIITRLNDEIEGDLFVFFVNQCSFDWSNNTYDYHYKHLRKLIDNSEIKRFDLSELPLVNDNGKVGGVFVFDFITSNNDLKNNCKYIIEHFSLSAPFLGYYSMEKEHDEDELLKLAEKHDGYLNSEEKDIEFIKECLLKIRKHTFFSYIAIPNTWIGEAGHSKETKEQWLDTPTKYDFKTKDDAGLISGKFSIDGGMSYEDISIEGDGFDVDETAKFTYLLFKNMGVLSQFKKKGHKAIQFMNNHNFLAYH